MVQATSNRNQTSAYQPEPTSLSIEKQNRATQHDPT